LILSTYIRRLGILTTLLGCEGYNSTSAASLGSPVIAFAITAESVLVAVTDQATASAIAGLAVFWGAAGYAAGGATIAVFAVQPIALVCATGRNS
jgi:hypothetical protein